MGADTAHRLPNVAQRNLPVAAAVIVDLDRHIDRRSVQVARFLILLRQARKTKRHPRSINVTRNAAHDWRTVLYFDTYLRFVLNVRKTRKHRLGIRPVAIIDLNPCEVRRTVSGNNRRVVQIDRAKTIDQTPNLPLRDQINDLGILMTLQTIRIFNSGASGTAAAALATAAALAHHISRHACCLVSIPAEITAEPTIIRP